MKNELGTQELLSTVFGAGMPVPEAAPLPTMPAPAPVKVEKPKEIDPFTALKAQNVYKAPMDTQNGGPPPAIQGGTADSLGTGGSWGKPK